MGNIPYGYCQCGCGRKTNVPKRSSKDKGWVKGVPMPFLRGHYQKKYGIPEHQRRLLSKSRTCSNNPNYKGGIYFDKHHGRWMIRCRDGSTVQYAVAVATNKYGRPPSKELDEIVHHIDGNKTNDNPDNLVILTRVEHQALHAKDPLRKKASKEKLREAGRKGGLTVKAKYGRDYYSKIARMRGVNNE